MFFRNPDFLKIWTNQHVGRCANFWRESPASAPSWAPKTGLLPARPRRRRNRGPVTAIRPKIGSPVNDGRLGSFFKKSGLLKKIWTNQHVGRGANFWRESPDSAPFWAPKRGSRRRGPDVAEIGPLLPRFGPKSGRPEMMAGWPDVF